MRIQNTPRASQLESYWSSQGQTNLSYWRIPSLAHFLVALATSWSAKGYFMRIQNMAGAALFYHIGA